MKIVKYGLLGLFVVTAIAVMSLPVMASEGADLEATLKELDEAHAAIDAYVATLSPADQAKFHRMVGQIEEEYDNLDDLEDEFIDSDDDSDDELIDELIDDLDDDLDDELDD